MQKNEAGDKMKPTRFLSKLCLVLTITAISVIKVSAQGKWVAPPDACNVRNPLEGNTTVLNDARTMYTAMCAPCHGDKGRGDGPAAAALSPRPADHSSKAVQSETDGSLYWKMTNGRGPMQPFKNKLTDAQRWAMVNYIRTLKK